MSLLYRNFDPRFCSVHFDPCRVVWVFKVNKETQEDQDTR